MAKGDVGAVIACIRYYAGWADKIEGKTIDIDPEMLTYTRREPVSFLYLPTCLLDTVTNDLYRLVFAVRSSPGTSLF